MTSIASDVPWGSVSPDISFDFSYEKKREGSTQYYKITVACKPLTSGYFGYPIYVQITLDGIERTSYTLKNPSPNRWSSAISNTTGWLSVSNKTSGTTAIKIKIYSGSGSSRTGTYNYGLAIDPAASSISCTTADIESNPTITISKADPNFTHTITYTFVGLGGTIAEKTSDTTITKWTIPAEFYAKIPNSKKGQGNLTCVTYSGNTEIGTKTCELNVTTNEAKCKPSVSGTVVDANLDTIAVTGDAENTLVRYHSNARCTIATTLNKSAGSIKAKTINNIAVTGDTLEIPNVETGVFEFWAKDSREYPNSDKETKTLIPYVKLTANVEGQRTDPTSGNATLKIKGNYFAGDFGAQSNELSVKYSVGDGEKVEVTPTIDETKNEYSATVSLEGLTYTQSFTIEVEAADKLETVTKTLTIPKGIPVFDWGEEDFSFNVPVTINGVDILEKLAELERLVKG